MSALHSDESNFETAPHRRSDAMMKQLRGRLLTMVWAAAVIVATAGWFYFILRGALLIVNWFFR